MININFANNWIQTVDIWFWKRLLCQLSHNHCPITQVRLLLFSGTFKNDFSFLDTRWRRCELVEFFPESPSSAVAFSSSAASSTPRSWTAARCTIHTKTLGRRSLPWPSQGQFDKTSPLLISKIGHLVYFCSFQKTFLQQNCRFT